MRPRYETRVKSSEPQRDIPGALGGSRLLARPEVAAEISAYMATLAVPKTLLEIGFDHGRRLSATAAENPDWQVIGIEVRERQVLAMRRWAADRGLLNLHAFRLDARVALANATPPASFDVIEALFPTPWPEGRARRRLLVTPEFLKDVKRALKPGGILHVATDVAWYADLMREALSASEFVALNAAPQARPACSQQSRREWKCAREGLPVYRFWCARAA
jgi:tRNA (guanine-N7-)-methyltransferase